MGEAKVRSGLWVLTEDVAVVAVTSVTGSAKMGSIRLAGAVIGLVVVTGSAAIDTEAAVTALAAAAVLVAVIGAVSAAARAAAALAVARAVAECRPR